jgi:hypothetical protein
MAGKSLPRSGDASFESLCDPRIVEQVFNGLPVEVSMGAELRGPKRIGLNLAVFFG